MAPFLAFLVLAGCASTNVEQTPDDAKLRDLERQDHFESRWRAAQRCAELAEETSQGLGRGDRQDYAKRGIEHAKKAILLKEGSVEGHYYHALCIGRLLEAERLPSLSLVSVLEQEALRAAEIDPRYESAGAHRMLGCLYRDAPEIGPCPVKGDPEKSEEHFQQALRFAPESSENHFEHAKLLGNLQNFEEAIKEAEKAIELIEKDPEIAPEQKKKFEREIREAIKGWK